MTRRCCVAGVLLALVAAAPARADTLHTVCLSERALLSAGEHTTVTALTDAQPGTDLAVSWSTDGGTLEPAGGPGATQWSPDAHTHGVFTIRAHVQAGGETAECSVRVAVSETPNRGGSEALISTRALLVPTAQEAPDYGLYSYVLFAAPPTDQQIDLYDAVLKSYLTLLRNQDMLEARFPNEFTHPHVNVTYVPVAQALPDDFDQREPDDQVAWIRNHYDYDRAFAFIARLRTLPDAGPALKNGTILIVSCLHPLGGKADPRPGFAQDLSAVPPAFIAPRMRVFASQTAQPRDYNPYSLAALQIELRIGIARGTRGMQAITAAFTSLGGFK